MPNLNIIVLFGGKSSERDISILSGTEVIKGLNKAKYHVFPIEVLEDGLTWQYKNLKTTDYYKLLKSMKTDLVFIALHGKNGEDGKIQGLLELLGFNYTGSDSQTSSILIDKEKTKFILHSNGFVVPTGVVIFRDSQNRPHLGKYPLFVKPNSQGSSVGSSIVKNSRELKSAVAQAFKFDDAAVVEEYIKGTEITVPVLGNSNPLALPPIEIVSKNEFFDYDSKYNPDLSDEICPAGISEELSKKAKELSVNVYKLFKCRDFARIDMIIKNKKIYVLEVNTIPGLTSLSLFPKSAQVYGYSFSGLLDEIINYANDRKN